MAKSLTRLSGLAPQACKRTGSTDRELASQFSNGMHLKVALVIILGAVLACRNLVGGASPDAIRCLKPVDEIGPSWVA